MIQLTQEQKKFLDKVAGSKWSINPETGLIDVDGDVTVPDDYISDGRLPVHFGEVTGAFDIAVNELVTLEGCPYWVGGDFNCANNKISSLKYAPKYIGDVAYVRSNSLKELDWTPDFIGGKLVLDLGSIDAEYHGVIIYEMEELISKGIKLYEPDIFYNRYREIYLSNIERKLIELL